VRCGDWEFSGFGGVPAGAAGGEGGLCLDETVSRGGKIRDDRSGPPVVAGGGGDDRGETQAWFDYALDCGYVSAAQHGERDGQWRQVGLMLAGMIEKAVSFCEVMQARRVKRSGGAEVRSRK
jgi:hypothetical protein